MGSTDVPLITTYNTSVVYHGLLLVDLLAELLAELFELSLYNLLKGRETWLQTEFDSSIYVDHLNI